VQALQELDQEIENWVLMKDRELGTPSIEDFLKSELNENENVYFHGSLISEKSLNILEKSLSHKNIKVITEGENPIDTVWNATNERPKRSNAELFVLDVKYTGETWQSKITRLRQKMSEVKASSVLLHVLDDIAWLFNLRGGDIENTPIFFSYCLVTESDVYLYLQACEDPILKNHFAGIQGDPKVHLLPYDTAGSDLTTKIPAPSTGYCWITESLNIQMAKNIKNKISSTVSQVCMMKAIKNETEINSIKSANVKASIAISKFLAWLEENYDKSPNGISECDAADKLEHFYRQGEGYKSLSFTSISSSNENGCSLHYHPIRGKSDKIINEGVYLIDSGAQYLDGTTDTTRTIFLSRDTSASQISQKFNHVKECYTRVLKCHINLTALKFPKGTTGYQVDIIARKHLWDVGLDFLHGTGHGIGHVSCVHEDPFHWGVRPKYVKINTDNDDVYVGHMNEYYLQHNYVLSNEPGYYEEAGGFGIRIENAIRVVEGAEMKHKNVFKREFYGFEDLIYCPYSKNLVDVDMLTHEEKQHLNAYNEKCRDILLDKLGGDKLAYDWVFKNTEKYD